MQFKTETLSQDEAIEWLVNDDVETIKQSMFNDDFSYLSDILRCGKAYNEWSMQDLLNEIAEREGLL